MRGRMRATRQLGIAAAPLHGRAVDEPTPGYFLTWEFALVHEGTDALKGQSKQAGRGSRGKSVVQGYYRKYCHSAILVATPVKSSQGRGSEAKRALGSSLTATMVQRPD